MANGGHIQDLKAKLAVRARLRRLNRAIDWTWRPVSRSTRPPCVFYAVYRQRNARTVAKLISDTDEAHLWALDGVDPHLEPYTRGTGAGMKFELLNQLIRRHPPPHDYFCVISDDDYEYRRGSLPALLTCQAALQFGLVQPAHAIGSHWNHYFTLVRPRLTARRTRFVEVGPVFVVAPHATGILPFPDDAGMGWGLEACWAAQSSLAMGIVDAVTICHLEPTGGNYDVDAAASGLERRLASAGTSLAALMTTEKRYWRLPKHVETSSQRS